MRKIIIVFVVSFALLWSGIFLFAQHKINLFIQQFSDEEVQISYNKLYVKFGITHPLTIILKDMKAVSNGAKFHTDLRLYPTFSNMLIMMNLSINYVDNHCDIPIIITTKKSENNNFYLASMEINNAHLNINDSRILIDGGIEFYQDKLPIGGYDITISDTQKLLSSTLFTQYPNILYKTQKILDKVESTNPKFRLDYTETGMKLDGIPVENL